MSRWHELARRMKEQEEARDGGDIGDDNPPTADFVPIVPIVSRPLSLSQPLLAPSDPAAWARALARIDASCLPAGFDRDRWQYLLIDARWVAGTQGDAAAVLGWTASDLFGIGSAPGWGGLVDRQEATRSLVLTDRIAHWRSADLDGWLWRATMRPMPLI